MSGLLAVLPTIGRVTDAAAKATIVMKSAQRASRVFPMSIEQRPLRGHE